MEQVHALPEGRGRGYPGPHLVDHHPARLPGADFADPEVTSQRFGHLRGRLKVCGVDVAALGAEPQPPRADFADSAR